MGRRTLADSRVREIIPPLVGLYLRAGSVSALTQMLSSALPSQGADGKVHPNRIHGLLSADPNRSLNDRTLQTLEAALEALARQPVPEKEAQAAAKRRADILERATASGLERMSAEDLEKATRAIASELEMPLGVILSVLEGQSHLAPARATAAASDAGPRPPRAPAPDWSYQDMAYQRCRAALRKSPNRKVGLVIPTGGGKTRVALRIVLGELSDAPDTSSVVLWVTHRRRLASQARRELQEMVTNGAPGLPEDSVALLAQRVEFILVSQLDEAVFKYTGRILLIVVDEAHHAAAPSYRPLFEANPSVRGLFLTATPRRRDERHIGIDEIAYTITYRELFERGALIEPTFSTFVIPLFSWDDTEHLDELANYVLDRAEREFVKTLLVVPTVEKLLALHQALEKARGERPAHILSLDDIAWVHGEASSTGAHPEIFLDEFQGMARGILVATSSLLGEGFDDRQINAVVITYPSTSLVQLMQVAGRSLRFHPDKHAAYVVQVKESDLAYHFEQRWLYREISDLLRPQLQEVEYTSHDDLQRKVEDLLDARHVESEVRAAVLARLADVKEGETCSLLLSGWPYQGDPAEFQEKARWGAILETESTSATFRTVFNEFCEQEVPAKDIPAFLRGYVQEDQTPGSDWRAYTLMLLSMDYARKEIRDEPYYGRENRHYIPSLRHHLADLRHVHLLPGPAPGAAGLPRPLRQSRAPRRGVPRAAREVAPSGPPAAAAGRRARVSARRRAGRADPVPPGRPLREAAGGAPGGRLRGVRELVGIASGGGASRRPVAAPGDAAAAGGVGEGHLGSRAAAASRSAQRCDTVIRPK